MWRKIKNYYHFVQALIAAIYFKFPSYDLTVIGVTGTDGKTTTVNMIFEILKAAGYKVSMISTIKAIIGEKQYDTGFHVTTPSPWQIQKYLKEAKDAESSFFVLEATSHGLDQNRLAFIKFDTAILTNITNEHLDYHKTWENYAAAKAKLFKNIKTSVLNKDDKKSFDFLKNKVDGKIITYSLQNDSDVNPGSLSLDLKVPGEYNRSNAYAVAAYAISLGIKEETIKKALDNFRGVTGRMEEIKLGQNFRVFVDFAHTPNALKQALLALRSTIDDRRSTKIIAVFGAAGERDASKRKPMGEIAAQHSDITVLTSEDPRSEEPHTIINEIAEGFVSQGKKENEDFYNITDRKEAINFAIQKLAKKGDIAATFGKSHEKSIAIKGKEYPWNEFEVVKRAIKERLKNDRK